MAYENLIADCITCAFRGEENNSPAEVWADSIVRARLAGYLLENVNPADLEAVSAEVSNYLAGLAEMSLDDVDERLDCDCSSGKEEEAVSEAWVHLMAIKLAAEEGQIDENKVLKLVIEHISEIVGD